MVTYGFSSRKCKLPHVGPDSLAIGAGELEIGAFEVSSLYLLPKTLSSTLTLTLTAHVPSQSFEF